VDAGIALWRGGRIDGLVVSGRGEAASGAARARAAGVVPVLEESEARNTWENLVATAALLADEPGPLRYLISDGWHLPRALQMARLQGLEVRGWPAAAAPWSSTQVRVVGREAVAWGVFVSRELRKRLGPVSPAR
jgi:uncharacterized SAM-binding protein YcdF (DUF218 family)